MFLILRGANTVDDLSSYGLGVAQKYAEANTVILIDENNKPNFVKGSNHPLEAMKFLDLWDPVEEFSVILMNIYNAYRRAHPGNINLAKSFVANWLFTWFIDSKISGQRNLVYEVMNTSHIRYLRKSSEEFIEQDFGMNRERVLKSDGSKRINNQTKGILGSDSSGKIEPGDCSDK